MEIQGPLGSALGIPDGFVLSQPRRGNKKKTKHYVACSGSKQAEPHCE
jgi:hypothetical protein